MLAKFTLDRAAHACSYRFHLSCVLWYATDELNCCARWAACSLSEAPYTIKQSALRILVSFLQHSFCCIGGCMCPPAQQLAGGDNKTVDLSFARHDVCMA
jgi:hypothetical protein